MRVIKIDGVSRRSVLRAVLVGFVAVELSACDTEPHQTASGLPPVAADKARFYFYRDPTVYDATTWTSVSLNRQPVGSLGPGYVFFRDVAPGTYAVEARSERLYPGQVKTVVVKPGSTVFVKVVNIPWWGQSPRQWTGETYVATIVDPAIGRIQIGNLRLTPG